MAPGLIRSTARQLIDGSPMLTPFPTSVLAPAFTPVLAAIAIASAVAGVDQACKAVVRAVLGDRTLSLGVFGSLRIVESGIWLRRGLRMRRDQSRLVMWRALVGGASGALVASALVPVVAPWFGLALGGAISHALETAWRGSVCDYVCPSFWPAFNLADVALAVGATGVLLQLARYLL